ncbi:OmpA family protein [Silicimonas sp. MF1-12-2]|uniref:OmpA family protein n=1 Tax=Silicimonas sp. MF1-12-2 TaxID=3384793 RepID=UPI0039B4E01E
MRALAALIVLLIPAAAAALDLTVPGAVSVRSETLPAGRILLPEAPWSPDAGPIVAEGRITREVLRVPNTARTSLQLVDGLRQVLEEEGYSEVFGCTDSNCGGFDFRFQLDILGEPDMFVDLGDYVYLLMRTADSEVQPHTVALVASRSQSTGFVHVTTVSEAEAMPLPETQPEEPSPPAEEKDDLIGRLIEKGHTVLPGLDFGSGSADLGDGSYPSLELLAEWLSENPTARVVLVGHTDSVGSLEANTALSRQRAGSVARFLVERLGAESRQIQSSGAGFLSPVASNLTEDGRAANRRVEVVLLSLDE